MEVLIDGRLAWARSIRTRSVVRRRVESLRIVIREERFDLVQERRLSVERLQASFDSIYPLIKRYLPGGVVDDLRNGDGKRREVGIPVEFFAKPHIRDAILAVVIGGEGVRQRLVELLVVVRWTLWDEDDRGERVLVFEYQPFEFDQRGVRVGRLGRRRVVSGKDRKERYVRVCIHLLANIDSQPRTGPPAEPDHHRGAVARQTVEWLQRVGLVRSTVVVQRLREPPPSHRPVLEPIRRQERAVVLQPPRIERFRLQNPLHLGVRQQPLSGRFPLGVGDEMQSVGTHGRKSHTFQDLIPKVFHRSNVCRQVALGRRVDEVRFESTVVLEGLFHDPLLREKRPNDGTSSTAQADDVVRYVHRPILSRMLI